MVKCPSASLDAMRSIGMVVNAVSSRLLYAPTNIPVIGSRFSALSNTPDTCSESRVAPVEKEIESYMNLEKDKTRDRKMAFILKELNKKINLRYDLDEKTEIVTCLYTYEGRGYIYVDKSTFCKLLYEKDIDIETLENV